MTLTQYQKLGSQLFPEDTIVMGILYRSINLVDGIIKLTENWNSIAATPLLRLQIDSLARLYYYATHPALRDQIQDVWNGDSTWSQIVGTEGEKLTDSFLVQHASKRYPWMKPLYKKTCGAVHFSSTHFAHAIADYDADRDVAKMQFAIGTEHWSEAKIGTFLDDVGRVTDAILRVAFGWLGEKRRKTIQVDIWIVAQSVYQRLLRERIVEERVATAAQKASSFAVNVSVSRTKRRHRKSQR